FGSKENPKGKLFNLVKPNLSDVFVFYSGHGAPGLQDRKAYFVPVESDPQYIELTGYPSDVFYNNLAKLPAKSVVVALDACFSGENIYENISPIVIKSKGALGLKDGALLASSQADQVSSWHNEKQHGLFTYFFLKAIHEKNADANQDNQLTLEEIHQYITDQTEGVPYYARRLHGIEQVPVLKGQNPKRVLVQYE
ncbi:MAG: caspase family protein, partial [Bacteroidota bacterium]